MEKQPGVSLATLSAYLVPLLVSERDAAPMVNGVTGDVGRHRILYCQAHELVPTLPAQHVREKLADPRDNLAFACARESVNHIKNWLGLRARDHPTPLLCYLHLHSCCDVRQHLQLVFRWAILFSVIDYLCDTEFKE